MDLIAAFFFADALVKALRISKVPDQTVSQITLRSIYVIFCLLITYLYDSRVIVCAIVRAS